MALCKIAVAAHTPSRLEEAEQLAAQLNLPMVLPGMECQLLLRYGDAGLELVKQDDPNLSGAVRVDFVTGRSAFRRQQQKQQKQEMLVRAVGFKPDNVPDVLDATGGLGRDSFILAAAGCRVQVFEQHPVIAALLADGLQHALAHSETSDIARRIRLINGDSVTALQNMQQIGQKVDVVYLDPMFPGRRKSALVKKELQMLQMLATEDQSGEQLMKAAFGAATKRVVVKRPVKAPCLGDRSPSHSLTGKTIRFDVYIIPDKYLSKNNPVCKIVNMLKLL